jgi:hypothetical protein
MGVATLDMVQFHWYVVNDASIGPKGNTSIFAAQFRFHVHNFFPLNFTLNPCLPVDHNTNCMAFVNLTGGITATVVIVMP